MIIGIEREYLRFADEPANRVGIDGAVSIALKLRSRLGLCLQRRFTLANMANPRLIEEQLP
jgi:hypothetical protein